MLKFSTTNFRSESWKLFCLVGAFIQRHSLCIFCVARIKGQADFVQRRHVCNFEHAISTSDHISNACLLMDLLTVIEEPEAGKDYRGRSRSLFTDFSPFCQQCTWTLWHSGVIRVWDLSFLMNFFDCPLASSFNWELSWSWLPWLELLQRCVGQVQSCSCVELRSRMWSCAQSSKLHHIPQMRLCICRFVSFGCSNIEKWYCISITNHKQNFPTLNELFVPGCWFFACSPTPSVSDHAMPCTRLHHLKTWHCGSERQEIIFGLRWMLGNLWKFDLYESIKTGFDDLRSLWSAKSNQEFLSSFMTLDLESV